MLVHFLVPTCHKGLADDVTITWWWYDFLSSILEHSCLRGKIHPDQTVSLLFFKYGTQPSSLACQFSSQLTSRLDGGVGSGLHSPVENGA